MEPITAVEGIACPLPIANIDTDQLIPARFMRKPRSVGYARFLLHDHRFEADSRPHEGFPLNRPAWRDTRILVTGPNFGCGSSRESAVYALQDHGIRSVIAESFGDIFHGNALKNGLLPVRLEPAVVADLTGRLEQAPGARLRVDLVARTVSGPDITCPFEIDPFARHCLLNGIDDIRLTREQERAIEAFEERWHADAPWSRPAAGR